MNFSFSSELTSDGWKESAAAWLAEIGELGEPTPSGGDLEKANRYRRVPYFHLMEWHKPAAGS